MRTTAFLLLILVARCAGSIQAPVDPPGLPALIQRTLEAHPDVRAAQARAVAASENSADRLLPGIESARLKCEVRRAYADAWLAYQRLRNNLKYLQLMAEMESAAQAAVEAGMATASDVLKAKAESLMFTEARMDQLQAAASVREELTRLAGPTAMDPPPPFPEQLEIAFSLDKEECILFALAHSRDLAFRQAKVVRLKVGGGLDAEVRAAEAEEESLRLKIRAEVGTAFGQLNTLRHHLVLHREHLLPLRDRVVQAVRAEVEAGRRSLMDLIEARRMELDEKELNLRHQAEAMKVAAELDRLAGGDWILEGEE